MNQQARQRCLKKYWALHRKYVDALQARCGGNLSREDLEDDRRQMHADAGCPQSVTDFAYADYLNAWAAMEALADPADMAKQLAYQKAAAAAKDGRSRVLYAIREALRTIAPERKLPEQPADGKGVAAARQAWVQTIVSRVAKGGKVRDLPLEDLSYAELRSIANVICGESRRVAKKANAAKKGGGE